LKYLGTFQLKYTLFSRALRKVTNEDTSPEEFLRFQITKELMDLYENACQLKEAERLTMDGPTMAQIDEDIEKWTQHNSDLKMEFSRQYMAYFKTEYFPYSEFQEIYHPDPAKRVCHYCKVSDAEIKMLRSRGRIRAKANRGYSMEIDRQKPNLEYSKENCVLACYWCNNAKTDEFSYGEFSKHIGPSIQSVWKERRSKG